MNIIRIFFRYECTSQLRRSWPERKYGSIIIVTPLRKRANDSRIITTFQCFGLTRIVIKIKSS